MIYIAHRGNIDGRKVPFENKPDYIDAAISKGYDVEIDVRLIDGEIYLGHNHGEYKIDLSWIIDRKDHLWVHCKNMDAMVFFETVDDVNYFWHTNDDVILTSKKHMWAYPGKQPIKNSIAVIPEIFDESVEVCKGICSDIIEEYRERK